MSDQNQPQPQQQVMQQYQQPLAGPVQYIQVPMIQTPQGWVPYQQGMGQVAPAPVVAQPVQQPMKMGSALITLAVVGIGIKMLYEWAKDREGGDGGGHHSREDHVNERQQRRSKSRMLAEFERYIDTHYLPERVQEDAHESHSRERGYHDVREDSHHSE